MLLDSNTEVFSRDVQKQRSLLFLSLPSTVFHGKWRCYLLNSVQFFGTLWTVDHQAPLSMEFSRHAGMNCHFLFQGIFLTQGFNLGLLHCRQILYHLHNWRSPFFTGFLESSSCEVQWATKDLNIVYMQTLWLSKLCSSVVGTLPP